MGENSKIVEHVEHLAELHGSSFPVRGAIATFLFKVMPVDGQTHPKELDRLVRILSDEFSLEQDEAADLITHARDQENTMQSLRRLADILKNNVEENELITLISHMWEIVFADGRLHETEILFVERVASLLEVSPEKVSAAMSSSS